MKFAFYTLGCKVNQYETQAISENIIAKGHQVVHLDEPADVFIINSCTVTAISDKKTRQMVRKFKRENPDSIIVLTGCMPQAYPEDAKALIEADIVLGNKNNHTLIDNVLQFKSEQTRILDIQQHESKESFSPITISGFNEKTRAFIKIQDGCNRFCSYCIIPTARGRSRSKALDDIITEAAALGKTGFKEIVLTGINLSWYGKDIGSSFLDVIKAIAEIPFIERIHLSSLEPDLLTEDVIYQLSKIEKLCPHFHLSMQSGCDKVLKAMNRHYTSKEYFEICKNIYKYFSNASITTDFLVGFPSEADNDFRQSLDFIQKVGFSKVHVFPYSARPNTKAATLPEQIPSTIKKQRAKRALEIANLLEEKALQKQVGLTAQVLFEQKIGDNIYIGYSKNYTPVHVTSSQNLTHQILPIKITIAKKNHCIGEFLKDN